MAQVGSRELEDVAGLDRYTIARQFRAQFGTSPHRYLLIRRLGNARERISLGEPLADIAADTGFADQAHLTRHFKKAYGMTPGRWAQLTARCGRARKAFPFGPKRSKNAADMRTRHQTIFRIIGPAFAA